MLSLRALSAGFALGTSHQAGIDSRVIGHGQDQVSLLVDCGASDPQSAGVDGNTNILPIIPQVPVLSHIVDLGLVDDRTGRKRRIGNGLGCAGGHIYHGNTVSPEGIVTNICQIRGNINRCEGAAMKCRPFNRSQGAREAYGCKPRTLIKCLGVDGLQPGVSGKGHCLQLRALPKRHESDLLYGGGNGDLSDACAPKCMSRDSRQSVGKVNGGQRAAHIKDRAFKLLNTLRDLNGSKASALIEHSLRQLCQIGRQPAGYQIGAACKGQRTNRCDRIRDRNRLQRGTILKNKGTQLGNRIGLPIIGDRLWDRVRGARIAIGYQLNGSIAGIGGVRGHFISKALIGERLTHGKSLRGGYAGKYSQQAQG